MSSAVLRRGGVYQWPLRLTLGGFRTGTEFDAVGNHSHWSLAISLSLAPQTVPCAHLLGEFQIR